MAISFVLYRHGQTYPAVMGLPFDLELHADKSVGMAASPISIKLLIEGVARLRSAGAPLRRTQEGVLDYACETPERTTWPNLCTPDQRRNGLPLADHTLSRG